ncbi:hypothetical protein VMT65_11695 [Nocardia sp. CDC153]|uniref:hypothetical protein n=1 Tax=Nocardia sp. CDC153 TaxID=3112167 RepID=UPI002DB7D1A2|nr:hypothetical protein [Nocardia sp. CDC153]MEC3953698.1 hypothetical protein [Nocardia sp. CDC153]
MTAVPEIPDSRYGSRRVPYWIPPHGFSNGVHANSWVILADLEEPQLYRVLFALTDIGVAGYVVPARVTPLEAGDPEIVWRLWVDTSQCRRAEDLLMELLRYGSRPPARGRAKTRRLRVPLVRPEGTRAGRESNRAL